MHFIHRLRGQPQTILVVVMMALFTDSFLYGLLVPLTPELNATEDEAELAVMYGGYALGLMLGTPVFGVLSNRLGRRRPMIWGVLGQIGAACLFALTLVATALLILLSVPVLALGRHPVAAAVGADELAPSVLAEIPGAKS